MFSLSSVAQPGDRKLFAVKLFYAKSFWLMRSGLARLGLYGARNYVDEEFATSVRRRYLRSLFAIYDVKEMSRLDLAWWTFDAMIWVDRFLKARKDAAVFEFGSGASTVWLARRARTVTSVEDDRSFFDIVDAIKPQNVNYVYEGFDGEFDPKYESKRRDLLGRSYKAYVTALSEEGKKFDLIVVDGRCRHECIALAPQFLKPGGAILVDNTDMRRYRGLRPQGSMKSIVTNGLTPCLPYPTETTVFV